MKDSKKYDLYIDDLKKMAESAFDLEDCKSCRTCKHFSDCFKGMRNSIGDLAETLASIFSYIKELDLAIRDIAEFIKNNEPEEEGLDFYS